MSRLRRAVVLPGREGLLTVVLVVAALAAGRAVEAWTPDDRDGFGRPFVHEAAVGDTVSLRYAEVRADRVDGAPVLDRGALAPMKSPGLWVVTTLTVTPTLDNLVLANASLVDGRGRELQLGGRNVRLCAAATPGVATACVVAFEVPVDAAAGSRLRVARSAQEIRGDDLLEVDLGITAAEARGWAARTDRVSAQIPPALDPTTGTRPTEAP
ncbi:hypothetical protein [Phycicoccus sonneratiae]|uniref:Uncharacterized protein n=1 Tax=Phycicoccus sonneratiae TaxID=2807628 RepID=A0ABS2CKW3_9MICO|nr:hypothetical protein [Phycicoccus sonneraticus]MBM6400537.1 hypothetical protein [Phycicoccus sonneraticus]